MLTIIACRGLMGYYFGDCLRGFLMWDIEGGMTMDGEHSCEKGQETYIWPLP